jgi:Holliday junction resolvasome RuvABC DNA-binding subunit
MAVRPPRLAVGTVVGAPATSRLPVLDEVFAALVQLGWRPAEAERALTHLEPGERDTLESLLRQALRAMPR